MKNIWNKFINKTGPTLLGIMWILTMFCLSIGFLAWSIQWMLRMIGVSV